jgi:hypothetical protein
VIIATLPVHLAIFKKCSEFIVEIKQLVQIAKKLFYAKNWHKEVFFIALTVKNKKGRKFLVQNYRPGKKFFVA